ncbi:MAG: hypothetical protein CMJ70_19915 [Planctomycetaceae bacterium]|nr:hypothetical protein [Planctomycetaceae bacterium]
MTTDSTASDSVPQLTLSTNRTVTTNPISRHKPGQVAKTILDKLSGTSPPPANNASIKATRFNRGPAKLPPSITSDILSLLNTSRYSRPLPDDCPELHRSLLTYGLPAVGERNDDTLSEVITAQLQTHEPRLQNVQVVQDTGTTPNNGSQRFLVQAEWSDTTQEGIQTLAIVADREQRIEEQDLD